MSDNIAPFPEIKKSGPLEEFKKTTHPGPPAPGSFLISEPPGPPSWTQARQPKEIINLVENV